MEKLDGLLSMLDRILNTQRKRHIAGGVLMSTSLLLGGLAVTILTIKEEKYNERQIE